MKKRIGILTFHRAKNYGAILQAYSLSHFLQKYGVCEIIDYRNKTIEEVYYSKKGFFPFLKKIAKNILRYKEQKAKKNRYNRFDFFVKSEINISKEKYDRQKLFLSNSKYDVLVVGSDQVWNTQLTKSDYSYFLDFSSQQTKIAYACSFGNTDLVSHEQAVINKYLKQFNLITIREIEGVSFVNESLGLKASLACDPVFLSSKETWVELSKKSKMSFKSPYIVIYEVANGTELIDKALSYAKEKQINVYVIGHSGRKYNIDGVIEVDDLGPYDFISIIEKSDAVFTTSFHGMALSLILNKQFAFELSKDVNNKNSRLTTLAKIFDVQERELQYDNVDKPMNWTKINQLIKQLSNKSISKLNALLGEKDE